MKKIDYTKEVELRNPGFPGEIVGIYDDRKLLCKDKYGEFTIRKEAVYVTSTTNFIRAAIDKSSYWVNMAKEEHGGNYNYSKVVYTGANDKVIIMCPKHGDFLIRPSRHIEGQKCVKCTNPNLEDRKGRTTSTFIDKAKKVHGDKYDYSKVVYSGFRDKVVIICKEHGEFKQSPEAHYLGHGCKKCASENYSEKKKDTTESFVEKAREIHGGEYNYDKVVYVGTKQAVRIKCKKHGHFEQIPNAHLSGCGCPKCSPNSSKAEKELADWVSQFVSIRRNDRKVLNGKEIDVFIPELNLGIEYNGVYWHSDKFLDKEHHLNKLLECNKHGIRLIQIFEDEWLLHKDIVKSRILSILGASDKIYARKTVVQDISAELHASFLEANHLQGKVGAKVRLGLFHKGELVSCMSFGKRRAALGASPKEGEFELLRFANKLGLTVVGGASKLFSHFKKNYNYVEIVSYADRRWSDGGLYKKLGMEFVKNTVPSFSYVAKNGIEREFRYKYAKHKLVEKGANKAKTAKQIMCDRGYTRVYDCGTIKFKVSKNE